MFSTVYGFVHLDSTTYIESKINLHCLYLSLSVSVSLPLSVCLSPSLSLSHSLSLSLSLYVSLSHTHTISGQICLKYLMMAFMVIPNFRCVMSDALLPNRVADPECYSSNFGSGFSFSFNNWIQNPPYSVAIELSSISIIQNYIWLCIWIFLSVYIHNH